MQLKGHKMGVPDVLDSSTLRRTYYFLNEIEDGISKGAIVVEKGYVVGWGIPVSVWPETVKWLEGAGASSIEPMTCNDIGNIRRLLVEAFHDTMCKRT